MDIHKGKIDRNYDYNDNNNLKYGKEIMKINFFKLFEHIRTFYVTRDSNWHRNKFSLLLLSTQSQINISIILKLLRFFTGGSQEYLIN